MRLSSAKLSFSGIALGAIALILALAHFWAGPFSPQPSLEKTVAQTAVSIRDTTLAALRGEEIETVEEKREFNIDEAVSIIIPMLGALAIILAVVGYATKESARVAIGAIFLGSAAIAFQFAAMTLGVLVVVILVYAVMSQLGFD